MSHVRADDKLTCMMCGAADGDWDMFTRSFAILQSAPSFDDRFADADGRQLVCSDCHDGAKHIALRRPSVIKLLSQVRRAGLDEQREVRDWLNKKFGGG